jgi:hypothetical protein
VNAHARVSGPAATTATRVFDSEHEKPPSARLLPCLQSQPQHARKILTRVLARPRRIFASAGDPVLKLRCCPPFGERRSQLRRHGLARRVGPIYRAAHRMAAAANGRVGALRGSVTCIRHGAQ